MRWMPALAVALLTLLAAPPVLAAEDDVDARLSRAWAELEHLEDLLDDDNATNDAIKTYMDLVVATAVELELPNEPADGDIEEYERSMRKWTRSLDKFQDETLDLLLEALSEAVMDRSDRNVRRDVNVHAGLLLGRVRAFLGDEKDRRRLSRRIIRKIKRLEKARHEVDGDVFEGAFQALARMGGEHNLDWLVDNYLTTRKQPEQVARTRAAMRALRSFPSMAGPLRLELVEEMLKKYVAMESLAEQGTADITAQAAKRYWDLVRTDAVPLIQWAAGYPTNESGVALATMGEFAVWFRDHDDPRSPPWTSPVAEPR